MRHILFSDVPMPVDVINVKSTDNSDKHKKLVQIVIYWLIKLYILGILRQCV